MARKMPTKVKKSLVRPKKKPIKIEVSDATLTKGQIDRINQAFSSQVLAVLQHWKESAGGRTEVIMEIGEPKIVSVVH